MLYKQIRCFLEVANSLSFTAAAGRLYMTQQAVTRQIAVLEKDLGVKLFIRSTRSVVLTPAGQLLRDEFSALHDQINDSVRRAKALEHSKRGTVTLGFFSAMSRQAIILPVTNALFSQFPDLYFDIKLLNFSELRNQLLDGKLDLCITTSNDWKLWPGVSVTVLQSKPFDILFSREHPLAGAEPFSIDCLKDYTHLTLPSSNLLPGAEEWAKRLPARESILYPDLDTLLIYLRNGRGFALLTRVFDGSDSPELCHRSLDNPEAHAEIVCIRRQEREEGLAPLVRVIRRCFAKGAMESQDRDGARED